MNEEVLIPKMTRIGQIPKRKTRIPIINLVLIFFAVLLLVSSTFINLNIKHYIIPSEIFENTGLSYEDFIHSFFIIPQIPIIMFIAASLGKRLGLVSIIIYIIAGLCGLPIFALGGGIKYIAQFGFGYILAYIPAVIVTCNILREKYNFTNMIKATIIGSLIIHLIGIMYMIIIALFRHAGGTFVHGWLFSQSGIKIIYDIIFGFVLVLIGKYIREGLDYISR